VIDRVDATCRKCGLTFSTGAQSRTTCPGCKAAVTVRRGGSSLRSESAYEEDGGGGDLAAGLGVIVMLVVVVGSWIWRGWRGGGGTS
jgi:hypothetical protein